MKRLLAVAAVFVMIAGLLLGARGLGLVPWNKAKQAGPQFVTEDGTTGRLEHDGGSGQLGAVAPLVDSDGKHCPTQQELARLVRANVSAGQSPYGQELCRDNWVYSQVTGQELDVGESDPTRIVAHWMGGKWRVRVNSGTSKLEAGDYGNLCGELPREIKGVMCIA